MTELERCALVSRELGESMAGSAARATGWIAIEHDGPWSPQAPSAAELGELADHLCGHDRVRVQLVRRVRDAHTDDVRDAHTDSARDTHTDDARDTHTDSVRDTHTDEVSARSTRSTHTVLLGHGSVAPSNRWLRQMRVERYDQLQDLDPAITLQADPPLLGEPIAHDVWLVCVHGRRDACCAVHGRPVAAALRDAGIDVFETTHTGGHRFAATAVVLPDGISLGRMETDDPVAIAVGLSRGILPAELLRGRCGVPPGAQAAEVHLRREIGSTGRDHVLPIRTQADGRVELVAGPNRWEAMVVSGTVDEARPVSDGAEPTHPAAHEVRRLRKLD